MCLINLFIYFKNIIYLSLIFIYYLTLHTSLYVFCILKHNLRWVKSNSNFIISTIIQFIQPTKLEWRVVCQYEFQTLAYFLLVQLDNNQITKHFSCLLLLVMFNCFLPILVNFVDVTLSIADKHFCMFKKKRKKKLRTFSLNKYLLFVRRVFPI